MAHARARNGAFALHGHLIGRPGSRWELNTPALVLDLDLLERNLDLMAAHCAQAGLALRPHAKTHKSVEIARMQMARGAVGICCAKLAEAEAMAHSTDGGDTDGGIGQILLTSPVVTRQGINRLMSLNARIPGLMVVVDNPRNVTMLDMAAKVVGRPLKVLVDVDPGLHRTGIGKDHAADLARQVVRCEMLSFEGLQCYAGHLMHVEDFEERRTKSIEADAIVAEVRDTLAASGIEVGIVTGGGTGSYNIEPEAGVMTELQAGSYIFMDTEYNDVPLANNAPMPFETSLFVQSSVVSNNTPGLVTLDAGIKSIASDKQKFTIHSGLPEGSAFFLFGDEQGGAALPDTNERPPLGTPVTLTTPHCDPTVNLYDVYHCVRGNELVDIWPVDARGCAQ